MANFDDILKNLQNKMSGSSKNNKQLGGKMKKGLLVFTILISMLSVVNVSQANAGCTAENPCGTWAMLDSQGAVTNVIVCQASVCGGGTWAGQTVVPQVAPNPVTHDTTGQGSYIGNAQNNTSVVYSEGTFTIYENTIINKGIVENNNDVTTISEVSIPVSAKSFTYEDTIGKSYGNVEMNPTVFNDNAETIVKVTETNLIDTIIESSSFYERKTTQEIEKTFVENNLNLLLSKIQTLISLLGNWVK